MANKDQSMGFRPFGRLRNASDYVAGGTVYPGDLLKFDNAGKVVQCAAGTAAAMGVALNYAVTDGTVNVADDPNQQFVVQADDATIAAQTNLNLNYNITVGTASTLYRRSAMECDASTGATDSNLPLKVLKLAKEVDNAFGDQADVICVINNHSLGNATEGI